MVSYETYQTVLTAVKQHYTVERGCMVRFPKANNLVLTVGCISNEGLFTPSNCRLWKGDEQLYEGDMYNKKILRYLNKYRAKTAEVMDTEMLANRQHGIMIDLMPVADEFSTAPEEPVNTEPDPIEAIWSAARSLARKKVRRQKKAEDRLVARNLKLHMLQSISLESEV